MAIFIDRGAPVTYSASIGHGSKATRQARLPSGRIALRLLGQLRAGYHARGFRPVHVAPLHAIWRQNRADRIAIVVDHQNRVTARWIVLGGIRHACSVPWSPVSCGERGIAA